MTKLNQILAIEKGVKAQSESDFTAAYRAVQKKELLSGLSRVYSPNDDDGEKFPPESTRVQVTAETAIEVVTKTLTRLFDVVLTKDVTNTKAFADVVVDGEVILRQVPTTFLLFIEKKLTSIREFVEALPKLDPAMAWEYDEAADAYRSAPVETRRTTKVRCSHVLYEATDKHPAQVESYTEDVAAGVWTKTEFSGALPAKTIHGITDRLDKLSHAVKFAREEANSIDVTDQDGGKAVFDYIFG